MYRVVLDPFVMLRGLLNRYSPSARLLFDYSDRYRAVFSDETLRVMRILLLHPFLVAAFPRLADVSQSRLSTALLPAERVRLAEGHTGSVFIATAQAAHVDFLVSEDPALLENHASLGLQILDAAGFLTLLDPGLFDVHDE
jgi:predicted nucleic acid-binding protein